MTVNLPFEPQTINWNNLWWSGSAVVVMIAVIARGDIFLLNLLHVAAGLLWTGIDLFMGFVVGPALRRTPFEVRRAVMTQLTPRTIFILPVLAIITGTTGWYLAQALGLTALPWPQFGWVAAALVLVTGLTLTGVGILLPTQIRVYRELIKPEPDRERIAHLSRNYFYLIALQGLMQVAMIVIMAKFRMGV